VTEGRFSLTVGNKSMNKPPTMRQSRYSLNRENSYNGVVPDPL